jgi:hypothetical protein
MCHLRRQIHPTPSAPTNLSATPVSSSQIDLSWAASTDNVGVTNYQVFRGSTQIATTTTTDLQRHWARKLNALHLLRTRA